MSSKVSTPGLGEVSQLLNLAKVVTVTYVAKSLKIERASAAHYLRRLEGMGKSHRLTEAVLGRGTAQVIWGTGPVPVLDEDEAKILVRRQLSLLDGPKARAKAEPAPESKPVQMPVHTGPRLLKTTFATGRNPWTGEAMK